MNFSITSSFEICGRYLGAIIQFFFCNWILCFDITILEQFCVGTLGATLFYIFCNWIWCQHPGWQLSQCDWIRWARLMLSHIWVSIRVCREYGTYFFFKRSDMVSFWDQTWFFFKVRLGFFNKIGHGLYQDRTWGFLTSSLTSGFEVLKKTNQKNKKFRMNSDQLRLARGSSGAENPPRAKAPPLAVCPDPRNVQNFTGKKTTCSGFGTDSVWKMRSVATFAV